MKYRQFRTVNKMHNSTLTCFIVRSFDAVSRNEFDLLKKNVLLPVREEFAKSGCNLEFLDAFDFNTYGEIKSHIARSIDQADLVIVVLQNNNPNVYLELGWAEGFWHQPIIICKNEFDLPVDIFDTSVIRYSEEDIVAVDGPEVELFRRKIYQKIETTSLTQNKLWSPFRHHPESLMATGAVDVYNRFSEAFTLDDWSSIINEAEDHIYLAGRSFSSIIGKKFFNSKDGQRLAVEQLMLTRALSGVAVNIIVMDEDNPYAFMGRNSDIDLIDDRESLKRSNNTWKMIASMFRSVAQRQNAAENFGSFNLVEIKSQYIPFRATLTEKAAIVTPRFFTEKVNSGITLMAYPSVVERDEFSLGLYEQIKDELDYFIKKNPPSDYRGATENVGSGTF